MEELVPAPRLADLETFGARFGLEDAECAVLDGVRFGQHDAPAVVLAAWMLSQRFYPDTGVGLVIRLDDGVRPQAFRRWSTRAVLVFDKRFATWNFPGATRKNGVAAWAVDLQPSRSSEYFAPVHPIAEFTDDSDLRDLRDGAVFPMREDVREAHNTEHVYAILPRVMEYIYSSSRQGVQIKSVSVDYVQRSCASIRFEDGGALPPWGWVFDGGRVVSADGGGADYRLAMARLQQVGG